nr:MAG TPA: hypothetical protein [Bacteriophage sp.]
MNCKQVYAVHSRLHRQKIIQNTIHLILEDNNLWQEDLERKMK